MRHPGRWRYFSTLKTLSKTKQTTGISLPISAAPVESFTSAWVCCIIYRPAALLLLLSKLKNLCSPRRCLTEDSRGYASPESHLCFPSSPVSLRPLRGSHDVHNYATVTHPTVGVAFFGPKVSDRLSSRREEPAVRMIFFSHSF